MHVKMIYPSLQHCAKSYNSPCKLGACSCTCVSHMVLLFFMNRQSPAAVHGQVSCGKALIIVHCLCSGTMCGNL